MNPSDTTPELLTATFVVFIIAVYIQSWIGIIISLALIAAVFYFSRGGNMLKNNMADGASILSPCDGVVKEIHCDLQGQTHLRIENDMWMKRGLYAMFDGTISNVDTMDDATRVIIKTEVGRIVMDIVSSPQSLKWFANDGSEVQKGELLCFCPSYMTVKIVLPVYQSNFKISRGAHVLAGDVIGTAQQVWSL
jgi:hypothetical protein